VPNHEREIPALELAKPTARNGNELTVAFCPIECPLCNATIAANAARCQCGWRVPDGVNELPPMALSSEEISALSQGVQLDEPSKAR
jgi:predicted DNA-binding transcriptional regulator YafY